MLLQGVSSGGQIVKFHDKWVTCTKFQHSKHCMIRKSLLLLGGILYAGSIRLAAQSALVQGYTEDDRLLDRLESMDGAFADELHLSSRPLYQKDVTKYLLRLKSNIYDARVTNADMYNVNKLLYGHAEWLNEFGGSSLYQQQGNPIRPFYNNPTQLLEYNRPRKFYFSMNPKLGIQYLYDGMEKNAENRMYVAAGLELKTTIADVVNVYAEYTYNSENPAYQFAAYRRQYDAIPGAGTYNMNRDGVANYSLWRGQADIRVLKNHMNLSIGYGRHVIGDGYRSLMLSDFSEAAWFAGLQTKIWKLKYRNIYTLYQPQSIYRGYTGATQEYKFATTHHLSANLFRWLNVGLFESVIFGRSDRYEFGYLNPIIFYRSVERSMGSPDKILIGINAKAIPVKSVNIYGQFILNEFSASEFFATNGYWANKWGGQLGIRYYDAFSIPNLDLQLEGNAVRPFTYTSNVKMGGQILTNYTHYNQALAHPLGAAFRELVFNLRYQPARRFKIDGRLLYIQQTLDNGMALSNGVNILRNYDERMANYGFKMVDPDHNRKVALANLNLGYELWMNAYIELGATYRSERSSLVATPFNSLQVYTGFRMNLKRRDYAVF